MKYLFRIQILFCFLTVPLVLKAQEKCGTMVQLENKFKAKPALRVAFDARETQFQKVVTERSTRNRTMQIGGLVTIPVVFHVVSNSQSLVTDAQLIAQLDTINKDYAGTNGGASKIPSYFKELFGQSGIQFCLAQRTPDNETTTGIVRYSTSRSQFNDDNENIKHTSQGGADAWDPNSYLNVWVCDLGSQILGYSTFPEVGPANEQGVAIHYLSLPGSTSSEFNGGKTLTHEIGHYFNLYHIWGDDNGACSGTDRVDDTPNQGNSNRQFRTGVFTDNCTTTSPGVMYQNYMDYSPDVCLLMFTRQQVARMEAAFTTYRSVLSNSLGCTPINLKKNDASLRTISQPDQRLCANTFAPQVTIRNSGSEILRSATIHASIDNGSEITYNWTGALTTNAQQVVTLPSMQTVEGDHVLSVYTSNPNGVADEEPSNDLRTFNFIYYAPSAPPVTEGFEGTFPPKGWDIVNADGGSTWEKTNSASKTGSSSVMMSNFSNNAVGQLDYLRSPTVNIAGADSAFVSFQVAAATYNSTTLQGVVWDTLQVLISTDCGKTYTSVYKKWGSTLITRSAATRTAFTPTAAEWRREEINISSFVPRGDILVAFVNTNGNENDVYLDDINIRTVTLNPNLKEAGFLVSPNPTDGLVNVQFYPHPAGLKGIYLFNAAGQRVMQRDVTIGQVSTNAFTFDLSNYPAGLYVVQAIFDNKVLTKKIVKVN